MLYKIYFPEHTTTDLIDNETVYMLYHNIYKWGIKRNRKHLCYFKWNSKRQPVWIKVKWSITLILCNGSILENQYHQYHQISLPLFYQIMVECDFSNIDIIKVRIILEILLSLLGWRLNDLLLQVWDFFTVQFLNDLIAEHKVIALI